jgi:hypothetical protein
MMFMSYKVIAPCNTQEVRESGHWFIVSIDSKNLMITTLHTNQRVFS